MAISTIVFEDPPGVVLPTLQFSPGQNLRVGCHLTDTIGLPGMNIPVVFEMFGDLFAPYYTNTQSSLLGDAWVDWVLPMENVKAVVRVTALWPIGSSEARTVNVGIGVIPDPQPVPFDSIGLLLIGGVVLLVGLAAYRPDIVSGARKSVEREVQKRITR